MYSGHSSELRGGERQQLTVVVIGTLHQVSPPPFSHGVGWSAKDGWGGWRSWAGSVRPMHGFPGFSSLWPTTLLHQLPECLQLILNELRTQIRHKNCCSFKPRTFGAYLLLRQNIGHFDRCRGPTESRCLLNTQSELPVGWKTAETHLPLVKKCQLSNLSLLVIADDSRGVPWEQ